MKRRKTSSLYGDKIKDPLLHDRPFLRSEDLPEFRKFYTGSHLIDLLHDNENHLIVGRRGTGKTHLLGAFDEFIREECPVEFSVKISILEAVPRTPPTNILETVEFTTSKLGALMYDGFLKVLFKKLLDQATERTAAMIASGAVPGGDDKKFHKKANDILTDLLYAIEFGEAFEVEKKKKAVIRDKLGNTSAANGELSGSLSTSSAKLGIRGKIGKGSDEKHEEEHTTEINSILGINLFRVRSLILDLLEELRIDTLHILIDEWMELDKSIEKGSVQPKFAQYLKTTFCNDKKFSLKIATIWHRTNLYDQKDVSKSNGLQLRHDISRTVDLDTAFLTSDDEVFSFAKNILYKRLVYACDDVKEMYDKSTGEVRDIFVNELFDNIDNFKVFITASHGIPRDMMDLFNKCSLRIRRDFKNYCICHELIYSVSKAVYMADKRKNIDPDSTPQRLLVLINSYMESTGRRLFLVKNSQVKNSKSLAKLVDEELIHQTPSSVTPRSICDTHKCYLIDFGNYVDWVKTKQLDIATLLNESVLASFPDDFDQAYESYVLDVESIIKDRVFCPNQECGHIFLPSNPVYRKHKECPNCATEI